eukprot:COSAG01_NODE_1563_length_9897_cov_10.242703_10_plen_143_part_00
MHDVTCGADWWCAGTNSEWWAYRHSRTRRQRVPHVGTKAHAVKRALLGGEGIDVCQPIRHKWLFREYSLRPGGIIGSGQPAGLGHRKVALAASTAVGCPGKGRKDLYHSCPHPGGGGPGYHHLSSGTDTVPRSDKPGPTQQL